MTKTLSPSHCLGDNRDQRCPYQKKRYWRTSTQTGMFLTLSAREQGFCDAVHMLQGLSCPPLENISSLSQQTASNSNT